MAVQPVLFVSHGAPDLLLHPGATGTLWAELGREMPRPEAILVVSAHWGTVRPTVSRSRQPTTIHDFSGFPSSLHALEYGPPGAPALAARVAELLLAAELPVGFQADRGLDHGAWTPLLVMYPEADIPVTQLSIQPASSPEWHLQLGQALAPLRQQGVLILASGAVTHNFAWLTWQQNVPACGPGVCRLAGDRKSVV